MSRGVPFRRQLVEDTPEYPLLSKIRAAGATDYFALALNRTLRSFPVVTWATDRPSGFTTAELDALEDINPALAAIVETRAVRRITENLLDTYLGPQAGRRVLAGQIQRAEGEQLRAVIMMADMRGFTALSDRLPGDQVIELLDDYFDAIVTPIEARKGETLKFIGDGLLAIFPLREPSACANLLRAVAEARQAMIALNENNGKNGRAPLNYGIGVHVGDVMYGNIGAPDRLDFTVIGPAVNLVSRIEGLCARMDRTVLTSAAVAAHLPYRLASLGYQPVKGLKDPIEVFGLPEPPGDKVRGGAAVR